ncbi:hypothetical protein [Myxococcus virescens]|nr:hypothetical protein [Myxococcus virescens]SDE94324.1 hypothetical protein SAMN04488504_11585 [Myxococcus virescens]
MSWVDVLEEHLDEARFRWLQWERALEAADVTVEEKATREERLLAQPFSGPVLVEALESSPMRRRQVLAIRTSRRHAIPTQAFTHRQREALLAARAAAKFITPCSLSASLAVHPMSKAPPIAVWINDPARLSALQEAAQ